MRLLVLGTPEEQWDFGEAVVDPSLVTIYKSVKIGQYDAELSQEGGRVYADVSGEGHDLQEINAGLERLRASLASTVKP